MRFRLQKYKKITKIDFEIAVIRAWRTCELHPLVLPYK